MTELYPTFEHYTYQLQNNINNSYKRIKIEAELLIQEIELLEKVTNNYFDKNKVC